MTQQPVEMQKTMQKTKVVIEMLGNQFGNLNYLCKQPLNGDIGPVRLWEKPACSFKKVFTV